MSTAPTIVSTATAVPPFSASQDEMKERLRALFALERRRMEAAMALFDNAAVERRYSVEPVEALGKARSITELSEQYRGHAIALGRDVAARALAAAGKRADEIDLLITVSCTGIMIPSVDAHLVNELGFRSDVKRLPITELGCAGGAAALARASDFLVGFPEGNVLVVAIELPSLSLQRADVSLSNLVSTAIFGDGAAAAVLQGRKVARDGAGLRPAESRAGGFGDAARSAGAGGGDVGAECRADPVRVPVRNVQVLETMSHIFPRSTWALGFDLQSDGFHSVLSKDVPALLKTEIARLVRVLADRRGLGREQLSCFVLHPGGRKILDSVEEELGLRRDDTQPSWDVLRAYGNQSSASVLFVLHEWLTKRHPAPGAHGVLAAFGPGLTTEMLLLRWN